jgi:hypothetical protein
MQPCPAPTYAGVYNLATGTFVRAQEVGNTQNAGVGGVVYHNTCPSGYFYNISLGELLIDEGQILSTGSGGSQDSYTIDSLDIAYYTKAADVSVGGPGEHIVLGIIEDYDPCEMGPTALVELDLTGLPASSAVGTGSAWIVTIDLTGSEFCILGDADGSYGGDPTLDGFGFTYRFPDAAANGSAGPLMSGDPACATGDGTVWQNPGADGTGTGNQNLFVLDGLGCYWFGGSPFAGFYLSLHSDLAGDCAGGGCTSNDDCACADAISGDGSFAFDSTGFSGSSSTCNAPTNDAWFAWTATAAGDVTFDTCGTSFDTKIAVEDGCGGACLGDNDDSCGLQSSVTIVGVASGDVLTIAVGGWGASDAGPGTLNVSTAVVCTSNDDCACADAISGDGSFAFDSTGFSGSSSTCNAPTNDAWFAWTATAAGDVTFDTCGTSFDTKIAVEDGCGGACLGNNDDFCGLQSSVTIVGVALGDVLTIAVGGWGASDAGPGTLNVNTVGGGCSSYDEACCAWDISGDGAYAYDTTGATQSAGQCYTVRNDVWFRYTAASDGDVTFDTCGVSYDTKLAVMDDDCAALANCIGNDDACGLQSSVTVFGVTTGDVMLVSVGAYSSSGSGPGDLNVSTASACVPPGNDSCMTPDVIADGSHPFDLTCTTTGTSGQANTDCLFFGTTGITNDIWYEYTSAVNGVLVATTCGSSIDTKIAIYDGAGCGTGAVLACNDDDCGLQSTVFCNVSVGQTVTIQLGSFPGASGGAGVLTVVSQDLGLGSNYCASSPNSSGYPAIIASAGSDVALDNNLQLAAGPAPIGQPGIFFYGQNQTSVPLGNGTRCIGPGNYRILPPVTIVDTGAGLGFGMTAVDLLNPPAISGTITGGSTWNFQFWFRDPGVGAGTDLSDAQEISFN